MKRFLDCTQSDWAGMTRRERVASIAASEGRTMVSEITLLPHPIINDQYTAAELSAAFGADLLLFNFFDVEQPVVPGLGAALGEDGPVKAVKRLTGRPVGINLEPAASGDVAAGRLATAENAVRAAELGVDFVLLTGNPGTGVTNAAIAQRVGELRFAVGDRLLILAGKMHGAGTGEAGAAIITEPDVRAFVEAGADVVLFPAPGTVPGVTLEQVRDGIALCHRLGALAMTAIGTSQEDADHETLRRIALLCKMAGADLHHLGDAGHCGPVPESILAYSIAIRGKRHTYRRMAMSPNR